MPTLWQRTVSGQCFPSVPGAASKSTFKIRLHLSAFSHVLKCIQKNLRYMCKNIRSYMHIHRQNTPHKPEVLWSLRHLQNTMVETYKKIWTPRQRHKWTHTHTHKSFYTRRTCRHTDVHTPLCSIKHCTGWSYINQTRKGESKLLVGLSTATVFMKAEPQ